MIAPRKDSSPLSPLWWFWLPIGSTLVLAVVEQFISPETRAMLYQEDSVIEMVQALIAFIAAGFGFACIPHCKGNKWLMAWTALGALACLYIGLEEISYGQQIFHWQTPEEWKQYNHQWETNLHNTSSWLNEKPKVLLFIGVIVGGIVIPLLRWKKPSLLPAKFSMVYPDDVTFWSAALAIFGQFAKFLQKEGLVTIFGRTTEINEFFLYYFAMVYFILLRIRLKAAASA